MPDRRLLKNCLLLFLLALCVRFLFYFAASKMMPVTLQRFVTADTRFYYDPVALQMASGVNPEFSLLNTTRFVFLGYLSLFYRYFGYHYWPVSIFHCLLGAAGVVSLFLCTRLFLGQKTALVVGLVSAFQIALVYWTPFVTTEPLFLLIMGISLLSFSAFIKYRCLRHALLLLPFLLLASLSRPAGVTFSICLFLYLEWLVLRLLLKRNPAVYFFMVNLVVLAVLAALALVYQQSLDKVLAKRYAQKVLYASLYSIQPPEDIAREDYMAFSWSRLALPKGVQMPKFDNIPAVIRSSDIRDYLKRDWGKYLTLAFCKTYTLFSLWASEYSLRHNIFNLFFYGFIYLAGIVGMVLIWRASAGFAMLIFLALFSQVAIISFTYMDYDFRFRLPLEFVLNIPVGAAISSIFSYAKNKNSR